MEKIGGWYVSPEDQEMEFANLVSDIVESKLAGNYEDMVPEVVGGWAIPQRDLNIARAQLIANVIVDRIGVKS
jgi:hypothetical protein